MYAARENGEVWTIDASTGRRIEPTLDVGGFAVSLSTSPDGTNVLVTAWFDREDGDRYESLVFDGRTGVLLARASRTRKSDGPL